MLYFNTNVGATLRERNQRLSESVAEVVRRIKPRIIAWYDGKSENE